MEETNQYKTIVIDPPWPGPAAAPSFKGGGKGRDCVLPYTTMSGVQIAAMDIQGLAAPDAQLFLWTTARNIGDAFLLMGQWAFTYRGLLVWHKKGLGMGRHMRHQQEYVLWGGRPGAPIVEPKNCPRQVHEWPRPRRHSEKPEEAYQLFSSLSPEPRIDIFSRQHRPGYDAWGNETGKLDT